MKEHALLFGKDRSQVGIITESPLNKSNPELPAVLILNAGLIHRIGPNRIYVKLARHLAAKKFNTMRFDFSGVGDSGPRMDKLPHEMSIVEETGQAMDYLTDKMGIKHFILIGLCAGATNSFRVASVDQRVRGIVLINTLVPRTMHSKEMSDSRYYWKTAFFQPMSWLKFILLKANYRSILRAVSFKIRASIFSSFLKSQESSEIVTELKNSFRSIKERALNLLIISSGSDSLAIGDSYLRGVVGNDYDRMQNSGLLRNEIILKTDHNVTPIESQNKLIEIITEWLLDNFKKSNE